MIGKPLQPASSPPGPAADGHPLQFRASPRRADFRDVTEHRQRQNAVRERTQGGPGTESANCANPALVLGPNRRPHLADGCRGPNTTPRYLALGPRHRSGPIPGQPRPKGCGRAPRAMWARAEPTCTSGPQAGARYAAGSRRRSEEGRGTNARSSAKMRHDGSQPVDDRRRRQQKENRRRGAAMPDAGGDAEAGLRPRLSLEPVPVVGVEAARITRSGMPDSPKLDHRYSRSREGNEASKSKTALLLWARVHMPPGALLC